MSAAALHLEPVFFWLLHATAKASVLVGLILLLQGVLSRRLGARGRCCLWLILLTLLGLFCVQHSGFRQDHWYPWRMTKDWIWSRVHRPDGALAAANDIPVSETLHAQREEETMEGQTLPWPAARRLDAPIVRLLAFLWLAGAGVLAFHIVLVYVRLRRVLANASAPPDRTVLKLLDECRTLMGIRQQVDVLLTDVTGSPALFGCQRPRLLLPREVVVASDHRELRHVFLHELAHLKRHDILVAHAVTLLHIMQWFNPLVALAFRRMRADRELACDALALSVMGRDEARAYGHTVVRQLERLDAARRLPVLAALTGDKTRIKQRIALIAGFDRTGYQRSPLTIAFVVSLVCLALAVPFALSRTLGQAVESAVVTWDVRARRDLPTTHQDQHANIQRACIRNRMTGKFLAVEGERITCEADEPGDVGLWEIRFDEVSNTAESAMYLYSVPARKYLISDTQGNLALDARGPTASAAWGTYPRPQGVWLISHRFKDGYLRLDEGGSVGAVNFGRDARSYWDVHAVWRVKTSDDPRSNPQWQREHIPGPD